MEVWDKRLIQFFKNRSEKKMRTLSVEYTLHTVKNVFKN